MSAYESGLTYEQLSGIIAAGAAKSIEGSLRNNRGMCQIVLSYQKADPSAKTGKKQVRLTHQTEVPFRKNISKVRTAEIINEWKTLVLSDVDKASGASIDPTNTVRNLCEQFIKEQEEIGAYSKATEQGRKTAGINRTTATKRRLDVARLEGFAVYDMPLQAVTHQQLKRVVVDLTNDYSGETVRATFAVLSQVFKWALGKKADNPCEGLPLPPVSHHPEKSGRRGKSPRHENTLSKEAARDFVVTCENAVGKRQEAMLLGALLALTAGLRAEEACGLMWSDVHLDTDKPYMHIERATIRYKKDGVWVDEIGLTKTASSVRDVPLYAKTANVLRRVRDNRIEALKRLDLNEKKSINDLYVLGDLEGNFRTSHVQVVCFCRYASRNKLLGANGDPVSMHNMRDSFASRLVNEGVADTRVSKLLGHTSVKTTQDRYISSSNDDIFEAIEETSGLFSVDENEDQQPDATVYTLTPEEARIIEAYRAGTEGQRDMMTTAAEAIMTWTEKEAAEQRSKMKVI